MAHATPRIAICGAGIAGIAAAYHLAVVHGCPDVTLIEAGQPLSLTSDKSTEAYRNWWPGPDAAMTTFMNRSIDLLQALAHDSGNRFQMNRRGYLFASADRGKVAWLADMARIAEAHGAGPVRHRNATADPYMPSPDSGFAAPLAGADLITDTGLIRRHFPYLAPETCVVAHVRRAGWLSAQQLGMTMLEAARDAGVRLLPGRVVGADTTGGRVRAVHVETAGERRSLEASHIVIAAGPMSRSVAAAIGVELPITAERHLKISFADTLGIVPRDAPMLIWLDEQRLPWSADERALLASDASTHWLTEPFPAGVHGRPDGRGTTMLALFNYDNRATDVVFPLPEEAHYAEIALRGMTTMVPGFQTYVDRAIRPHVDGGYYVKTRENRPLIGPTSIEGVFVSAAYSGFGIMAACAGGDLVARHVTGAALPDDAAAFMLQRYDDPAYVARLDDWGDGGQL